MVSRMFIAHNEMQVDILLSYLPADPTLGNTMTYDLQTYFPSDQDIGSPFALVKVETVLPNWGRGGTSIHMLARVRRFTGSLSRAQKEGENMHSRLNLILEQLMWFEPTSLMLTCRLTDYRLSSSGEISKNRWNLTLRISGITSCSRLPSVWTKMVSWLLSTSTWI